MKKSLCTLLVIIGASAFSQAQTVDSLTARVKRIESRQMAAGNNLQKFHKEYATSLVITGASSVLIAGGAIKGGDEGQAAAIIGGAGLVWGFIQNIMAHHKIKLAGVELSGAGLKATF